MTDPFGPDLFGNVTRAPASALRPVPAPVALDLLDYAAHLAALASGRPLSQERAHLAGFVDGGPDEASLFAHAENEAT
ncbi:MAG: hypothetical protein JWO85_2650 [Candidatus Eremiobacteraeota bacterium]|nr:hypothetical protein [Candidatus Eremiobacteraeota bacterium]